MRNTMLVSIRPRALIEQVAETARATDELRDERPDDGQGGEIRKAAKIDGIAWGRRIFRRMARSLALSVRMRLMRSGSTDLRPRTVPTTIGKKAMMTATMTTGARPWPNRSSAVGRSR